MDLSRRDFLASGTLAAGVSLTGAPAAAPVMLAQAGPAPRGFDPADVTLKYDLVIANADVLDPSQRLRGKRDIGIKNGQIAALASTPIAVDRSAQRYDAAGKLTTPGLVDLHTHYGPLIGAIGLPADELVPITATTTGVSAGDAGANNFGALKHWVIGQARTRLFAFVHISSIGLSGGLAPGEMLNIDYANVDACARARAENPDVVLGGKVRITDNVVGQNGVEPLRRARRAAELAGRASASCAISEPRPAASPMCWTCCAPATSSRTPTAALATTDLGREGGQAARRDLRRGPRRWLVRLHGLRAGDDAGLSCRHDLERHPRGVHQYARLSDAAVGDVEVPCAGPAAGRGRAARDHRAGEDHRTRARTRHPRRRRARGRGDLRLRRRALGRVRGHAQQ